MIRLQFLDESEDYIAVLETQILASLPQGHLGVAALDEMLRSAHSLKGGAAMMGYHRLSELSHRFEDGLRVLRSQTFPFDSDLEAILLNSIDGLRQCVGYYRQEIGEIPEDWLAVTVLPTFDQLRDRLGEPKAEDYALLLSEEVGEDMVQVLFSTEVDGCLDRLEGVLNSVDQPCLLEEFLLAAQELGGLGDMLDLSAFSQLSASIYDHLQAIAPENLVSLAHLALAAWRRSQALVLVSQIAALPRQLELGVSSPNPVPSPQSGVASDETQIEITAIASSYVAEEALTENSAPLELPLLAIETSEFETSDWVPSLEMLNAQLKAEPLILEQEPETGALEFLSELEADSLEISPVSELSRLTSTVAPTEVSSLPTTHLETTIKVPLRQLEQLGDLFGELTIERNSLNLQIKTLRNLTNLLRSRVKSLDRSHYNLRNRYDQSQGQTPVPDSVSLKPLSIARLTTVTSLADFDQLELDRYSDLHPQLQDLMETIVQIQEVTDDLDINLDQTQRTARDVTRTSQLMQTQLTQVRMRPFADLANRFPRALRDLCLQYGKSVELQINGGNTLIDRTVLDVLGDPLLHLLRNAFDHGIEDVATRQAQGKPPQGQIELTAAYRGNQTVITLRDDGKGIDLQKIRAKAINLGLDAAELDRAQPAELLNLIFEPGFTTAEQVSPLSGRGVGMDIVRTQLQQIRGQVQVETQPGQGTTFILTLPFTLSVVRVLLVETAGLLLAFPTNDVEEMIASDPQQIFPSTGQELLNWEGYLLPLFRLRQWLPFGRSLAPVDRDALPVIDSPTILLIAQGENLVGLEVDRFWGEQEVTIRAIEGRLPLPMGFTGCTILGDGRVAPLIDATALLQGIKQQQQRQQPARSHPPTPVRIPASTPVTPTETTLLIIDDSITVRRFLALTLEKAGYRVQQAKDGQEALEKLNQGLSVEAIICDLEMPRLDGLGFLAQVKTQDRFRPIPVVMLTSRNSTKHRQIAFNLGATAYFSKPFMEADLLKTLQDVLTPALTTLA